MNILELEIAMQKTLENADELLYEAELLQKAKRYARAYVLGHLASEEMAKLAIISAHFNRIKNGIKDSWADVQFSSRDVQKQLNSHKEKIKMIILMDYVIKGIDWLNDTTLEQFQQDLDNAKSCNNFKNFGLYASLIDNKYLKPSEQISCKQAEELIEIAKLRLSYHQLIIKANQGLPLTKTENTIYKQLKSLLIKSYQKEKRDSSKK